MKYAVVVPFRDRGIDPLRAKNKDRVVNQWLSYQPGFLLVRWDGRSSSAPFNRHAAYNGGVRDLRDQDIDAIVFAESDMLISKDQVEQAVKLAADTPGLVVPFTDYHYLSPNDSIIVRMTNADPASFTPESVMTDGKSIGAINVVSMESMNIVGQWDETFEGNWYDDNAMKIAFEKTCGPTRWVPGVAHHLYHLPGWKGDHLTDADREATARNKRRLLLYKQATTADRIRLLTAGGGRT